MSGLFIFSSLLYVFISNYQDKKSKGFEEPKNTHKKRWGPFLDFNNSPWNKSMCTHQ